MLKKEAAFKSVVFAVALAVLMWMACTYFMEVKKSPIGTAVDSVPTNMKRFPKLLVCVHFGARSGYRTNHTPVPELFARDFGHESSAEYASILQEYERSGIEDPTMDPEVVEDLMEASQTYWNSKEAFLRYVNPFYDLKDDTHEKIEVYPSFMENQRPCGFVKGKVIKSSGLSKTTVLSSSLVFRFTVQEPLRSRFKSHISLYSPENRDHLYNNHLLVLEPKKGERFKEGELFSIKMAAELTQYLNLVDGSGKTCLDRSSDENDILPVGYAREACNMECIFEAVEGAYNCTPLSRYFSGSRKHRPCHSWVHSSMRHNRASRFKDVVADNLFNQLKRECTVRRKCDQQRTCEEWKIAMVHSDEISITNESATTLQISVEVAFSAQTMVVRQFKQHPWASILGNVGGLVGIWLGLSVFGVCEMLVDLFEKRKTKVGTRRNK